MTSHSKGKEFGCAMKERVVSMRLGGMKNNDIAAHFGVPETSTCRIWKRYIRRGTTVNAKRSGRPKKLNARDYRNFIRIVIRNRRVKLAEITSQLTNPDSLPTVRKSLHQLGLWN